MGLSPPKLKILATSLCVGTDTETIVVIHRMFADSCLVQVLAVLRRPQSPFVEWPVSNIPAWLQLAPYLHQLFSGFDCIIVYQFNMCFMFNLQNGAG